MALDVEDEDEHNDSKVADQSGEDLDYSQSDAEEEEASDHEQAGPSEQDWLTQPVYFTGLWPACVSQQILDAKCFGSSTWPAI